MSAMLARPDTDAWSGLLGGYRPPPGVADELLDRSGRVRPHWEPLLTHLAAGRPESIDRQFALADRHLKDSGVFYRVYDGPDGSERPWPLSHVPLVISAAEWQTIEAGVIQRAGLVEAVLADLYGPADLVRDGALPAAVIAGNAEFLRPLVGVAPHGGRHLVVYAVDLGRAPDGRWWVLGDRAQAPSGMGYALENRLAISTALSALHRDMHIERLAGFFQAMRSSLSMLSGREHSRVGLLTPGPANETYFEHAYLARYLGLLLVEGGDLMVQDGTVYVRTIEGPKRLDVLLRRLDASFSDPLEFTAASRIGVPGLVQAVRTQSVALANSLGAGLVEARSMLAFLPALSRRLTGADLLVPNVATWWCGSEAARRHVVDNLDALSLYPASSRRVPGLSGDGPTSVAGLSPAERSALVDTIEHQQLDIVAQESVRLSTMPVWTQGRLEPRPFTLRVFAVATADGWRVMRGGFCRVGDSDDPRALSMQRGGRSADVWVTSEGPVEHVTLLSPPGTVAIRRRLGHLPSRAADNLFWLGRYLERAEATIRVARTLADLSVEAGDATGEPLYRLSRLLVHWGATEEEDLKGDVEDVLRETFEGEQNGSLPTLVKAAVRTASVIRDRLSPEATRTLDDLRAIVAGDDPFDERAEKALRVLAALSGLAQENMNRISGWRFMQIGRRIERGIQTCKLAQHLADTAAREGTLDSLLRVTDSRITYRARYLMGTMRLPVLDLVVLDDGNPRSVAFQIVRLAEHLGALPGPTRDGEVDPPGKSIRILRTSIETAEADDVGKAMLVETEARLQHLSNEVTARYFGQGEVLGDFTEGLG